MEQTHLRSQGDANRAVNRALVVRNWLFGWYIAEFEQNGTDRADYGKETLKQLSAELKSKLGRGFSVDNLESMRRFYTVFFGSNVISETASRILAIEKSETPSTKLATGGLRKLDAPIPPEGEAMQALSSELSGHFRLSWSHYVTLLTIDEANERQFYHWQLRDAGYSKNLHLSPPFESLQFVGVTSQPKEVHLQSRTVVQRIELVRWL